MHRPLLLGASLVALAIAPRAHAQAAPPLPADSLEFGRAATRWLVNGAVDSLWARVTPADRGIFASRDSLAQAVLGFAARAGSIQGKVEERFVWRGGQRQYWQTVNASNVPEPIVVRWVMRPDGRMSGLGINPVSNTPPVDSGGPVIKP